MSRVITPALDVLLKRPITEPVFLITMGSFNLSTRGNVTVGTTDYLGGVASVLNYRNAKQGTPAELTIRVPSTESTILDFFLTSDWRSVPVQVYFTYNGAFDPADLVEILNGRINGINLDKTDLSIYAISQTSLSTKSPRVVCRPPLMNFLPPDGTMFNWGGDTLTINRR